MRLRAVVAAMLLAGAAQAQPAPALRLEVTGPPMSAVSGARPGCGALDQPDAPARAVRLATGEVRLYATDSLDRVEGGPDLLHLGRRCAAVMKGAGDPAALNDRASIASPWTSDGRTIWAVVRDQGHRRPALCSGRRSVDCWSNALTAAVSRDGGQTFQRVPGRALVAALPYQHDQPEGGGHRGYLNPSNIVTLAGAQYMFAFATQARAQRPGNCLLRTTALDAPDAWRGWDGSAFGAAFVDPDARPVRPDARHCAPVEAERLRWPVTGLVRHAASGLFIALMQNGARGGGVFYATSPDLLHWSAPALLMPAVGPDAWSCADPAAVAYPSLLDPAAADRNFETVGVAPLLFATRFNVDGCRAADRELVRWNVRVAAP